jgi:hypothetical protein
MRSSTHLMDTAAGFATKALHCRSPFFAAVSCLQDCWQDKAICKESTSVIARKTHWHFQWCPNYCSITTTHAVMCPHADGWSAGLMKCCKQGGQALNAGNGPYTIFVQARCCTFYTSKIVCAAASKPRCKHTAHTPDVKERNTYVYSAMRKTTPADGMMSLSKHMQVLLLWTLCLLWTLVSGRIRSDPAS